jgi:hypothetical protein
LSKEDNSSTKLDQLICADGTWSAFPFPSLESNRNDSIDFVFSLIKEKDRYFPVEKKNRPDTRICTLSSSEIPTEN